MDDLEAMAGPKKWTRDELNELKEFYKRELAKLRSGIRPDDRTATVADVFG